MKRLLVAVAFVVTAFASMAQDELPKSIFGETDAQRDARRAWWVNDRFGMFIHFGLYAMPARHEWVKSKEKIQDAVYDSKYFPRFDPDLFDAREWVRMAKAAGMKYIVLTAKHHEGFAMWDTDTTDYKITKTPFGRDLVREYVDACREAGMKVGFYYSIIDWHHPQFTVDPVHPRRPEVQNEENYAKLNKNRDMAKYREYMYAQVRELLTRYGKIDIIWYDYTQKGKFGKSWRDWESVKLMKMTRELQPGILVDSRLDLMETDDGWDFVTPEQFKVSSWPTVRGKRVPWETCQTFSGSWGYYRDEASWKSPAQLIELLSETVSKGGNLIMNVGPTARGEFDYRAKDRLAAFAKWMHVNSRSIYGCTEAPAEFSAPNGTALTYNPKTNRLYVHLYDYPMGALQLKFWKKIQYAQFLHDGSELFVKAPVSRHGQGGDDSTATGIVQLPILKPDVEVPVIELFLK